MAWSQMGRALSKYYRNTMPLAVSRFNRTSASRMKLLVVINSSPRKQYPPNNWNLFRGFFVAFKLSSGGKRRQTGRTPWQKPTAFSGTGIMRIPTSSVNMASIGLGIWPLGSIVMNITSCLPHLPTTDSLPHVSFPSRWRSKPKS